MWGAKAHRTQRWEVEQNCSKECGVLALQARPGCPLHHQPACWGPAPEHPAGKSAASLRVSAQQRARLLQRPARERCSHPLLLRRGRPVGSPGLPRGGLTRKACTRQTAGASWLSEPGSAPQSSPCHPSLPSACVPPPVPCPGPEGSPG